MMKWQPIFQFPRKTDIVFECLIFSQESLARDDVLIRINLIFNSQSPKTHSFFDSVPEAVMVNFNHNLSLPHKD